MYETSPSESLERMENGFHNAKIQTAKEFKGDVVINDYARAKSLFHDTQVSIFKKLYQEVELAIEKFRHRLMEQLMKLPATLEDQKKLIKYLASLECPGDPAWDCICNMNSWIIGLLNQCRDKHQALVYGDHTLAKRMCQKWFARLKSGNFDLGGGGGGGKTEKPLELHQSLGMKNKRQGLMNVQHKCKRYSQKHLGSLNQQFFTAYKKWE
ncbi:EXOC2 [Cordylochernes scorpioides]|uniref:Exocyst complex component 2 n=1 Tax=Cordylochernes scorpioides TaxID=51811 RepID=A0ABY6KBZ9_9ARAC|nr:EXOC2 [Cordylochernes scorpioides]